MRYRIRDGNDEEMPPLTEAQLRALADSGYISSQTLAFDERAARWRPISEITPLAALFQPGGSDNSGGRMPTLSASSSWPNQPAGSLSPVARNPPID